MGEQPRRQRSITPSTTIDRRKLRLITPCSPDSDIACWIKGAHLSEDQCIEYLQNNKFYKGTVIKSVIIDGGNGFGYCKKVAMNDSNWEPEYECGGSIAWYPCGSQEPNAVPMTVIEFIEFGDTR